jgi:protein-tyrosine phosphatase
MLNSAPNFRDIGGIALSDEAAIQSGKVYRSEAIHAPGADDAASLAAIGVRSVIDLRSAAERAEAPGYWPGSGVTVYGIELAADPRRDAAMKHLRADSSAAGVRGFLGIAYEAFPSACAEAVRAMFKVVAEGSTPLLVHCTAGKDRTGFLIATLLGGVGVPLAGILRDYLRSGDGISAANVEGSRFAVNHLLNTRLDAAAVAELCGVREEFLTASIRTIGVEYGSIAAYLAAIGVDAETVERARGQLLA